MTVSIRESVDIRSNENLSLVSEELKQAGIPDYVLDADLGELGLWNVPEQAFAATADTSRKLPCHTKAACFVSRVYFEKQRSQMPHDVASRIEAKLAHFESLHGIESDADIAVSAVKTAAMRPDTPNQVNVQLQNLYNKSPDSFRASELMWSARELKRAGVDSPLTAMWSFDSPLDTAERHINALAINLGSTKLAALAAEFSTLGSKDQIVQLGVVADCLQEHLGSVSSVQKKLAEFPTTDEHSLVLAGHRVPRSQVRSKLAEISQYTELDVLSPALMLPRGDWDKRVQDATASVQRQVLDLLG